MALLLYSYTFSKLNAHLNVTYLCFCLSLASFPEAPKTAPLSAREGSYDMFGDVAAGLNVWGM